jgi:hypothetical protein
VLNNITSINTGEGGALQEEIERTMRAKRSETVLIVGWPARSKLRACSSAASAEASWSEAGRRAPSACCAAVGPPRV